jgi:endonuclease/exonuclease/phosphatase family metal-dependent hydrolase
MAVPNTPHYSLRVATYNIHKCRGLDRRVRAERIVRVLQEIKADIIALQEVVGVGVNLPAQNHARFISQETGLNFSFGPNRTFKGGLYGNLLLSRLPLRTICNHDISRKDREPRGCLQADVELPNGVVLHVFNVHLGTAFRERREQARALLSSGILMRPNLTGLRIVLGDFNDWAGGLVRRSLRTHFAGPDQFGRRRRSRTFPAVLPIFPLDSIYFDRALSLERVTLHRSRLSLIASDHLPLVADFTASLAA